MTVFSKLYDNCKYCHCSQAIAHRKVGCLNFVLSTLLLNGKSGFIYFLPLLITPLVMKYKSMNRELCLNAVKNYLQTTFWATICTTCISAWACSLRFILGRFYKLTLVAIPSVLGMQFCWFFPSRVMKLFITATSQTVLEGILRQNCNKFTYLILHSPLVQTILFMLSSAIILHYKRNNVYKEFWFVQPYENINESTGKSENQEILANGMTKNEKHFKPNETKCSHLNSTCTEFMLNGLKPYYLAVGLVVDVLSMLSKTKIQKNSPGILQKTLGYFKNFRPNMTGFLISYIGLYRLSSCLLRKYCGQISVDLQHLISAALGGLSFISLKRVNISLYALILATQALWQQFCNRIESDKKSNRILLLLKNAPISNILFPLNCAYLSHNYFFNYHLLNSLGKGFIDSLCLRTSMVRSDALNHDVQFLIDEAKSNAIKYFL